MSVVGFDFGNQNCYIGVARQGGIEVITNDYSLHATPSCIQFDERTRVTGVAARSQMLTKLKNTIAYVKHLIGRKYSDPVVQHELPLIPCAVVKLDGDQIGLKVNYLNEVAVFTPEQCLAMVLIKLKQITELQDVKIRVTDCVISIPCHLTDVQRAAYLFAARIADLNCLKLITDPAAVALAYGIYKQDLPAEPDKPRRVLFFDMGHTQTQVCLADFNKAKLVMRGTAFDIYLGGRDFDAVLCDYFAADFKTRYNIDVNASPRHRFRLLDECEKLKKQMSANSNRLPLNIECFMDDKDVQGFMQRTMFEELCAPLWERLRTCVRQLLHDTRARDVDSVEMVGGASRMCMVKQLLTELTGTEPMTTMNMDDSVARGAAMQCAMLSPTFRVREFSVLDSYPYRIQIRFPVGLDKECR